MKVHKYYWEMWKSSTIYDNHENENHKKLYLSLTDAVPFMQVRNQDQVYYRIMSEAECQREEPFAAGFLIPFGEKESGGEWLLCDGNSLWKGRWIRTKQTDRELMLEEVELCWHDVLQVWLYYGKTWQERLIYSLLLLEFSKHYRLLDPKGYENDMIRIWEGDYLEERNRKAFETLSDSCYLPQWHHLGAYVWCLEKLESGDYQWSPGIRSQKRYAALLMPVLKGQDPSQNFDHRLEFVAYDCELCRWYEVVPEEQQGIMDIFYVPRSILQEPRVIRFSVKEELDFQKVFDLYCLDHHGNGESFDRFILWRMMNQDMEDDADDLRISLEEYIKVPKEQQSMDFFEIRKKVKSFSGNPLKRIGGDTIRDGMYEVLSENEDDKEMTAYAFISTFGEQSQDGDNPVYPVFILDFTARQAYYGTCTVDTEIFCEVIDVGERMSAISMRDECQNYYDRSQEYGYTNEELTFLWELMLRCAEKPRLYLKDENILPCRPFLEIYSS